MFSDFNQTVSTLHQTRFRHTAIIGQPMAGKSNLANHLVAGDLQSDHGVLHIDLDGEDTSTVLSLVPKRRIKDTILIDLADTEFPVALNPLQGTGTDYDATIADQLVDTFKSIWGYENAATPDMDRTIYNSTRAILDQRRGTLIDLYRFLTSEPFRQRVCGDIKEPLIRRYWQEVFPALDQREQAFVIKSTVNKLERFVSDARIRNVFCRSKSQIDFRSAIENRKIILISIPQQAYGLTKAKTVAGLILAQFFSVAIHRQGLLPFHVYLPNCQHLTGDTLRQMLATLGNRSVSITLSFQYLAQLQSFSETLFGSVGNWAIFRVGLTDALKLEELFEWDNTRKYLYELAPFEARFVTPTTNPHSVKVPLLVNKEPDFSEDIVKHSRHFYAHSRTDTEKIFSKTFGDHDEGRN